MQQLEVQQAALNSRLDSMTITISSSQDTNASAICDMRSRHFLTELIAVVGQQFGQLQADLKQNQANEIKANCPTSTSFVLPHSSAAYLSMHYLLQQKRTHFHATA